MQHVFHRLSIAPALAAVLTASSWVTPSAVIGSAAIGLGVSPLASAQPDSKLPKFDDIIKDLVPVAAPNGEKGMLQLWRTKPDDPKANPTKLICKLPRGLLNQDLLFATTITGGEYAGFQWSDYLVRFRLQGNKLILEAPDTRYITDGSSTVGAQIKRTYQPTIIAALPIITLAGADPVVDLAGMFTRNLAQAPIQGSIAGPLASYSELKLFPDNALIGVNLPYSVGQGQYQTVGVAYAFRKLPARGSYKPRPADERIGYFTTVRQDWAASHAKRDNLVRYVNRWRLDKQDASLTLSPPTEPIKFIIEDSVPVQWRRWVRAGIEEWNKAYEEVGFSEAIVVYQQTKTNEFGDIDPADARYNFIRWIVSGRPFAMGPSRVDPRTGQILDADIIIDDSFLRYMIDGTDLFSPAAMVAELGPSMLDFYQDHPEFIPLNAEAPVVSAEAERWHTAALAAQPHGSDAVGQRHANNCCTHAEGLRHKLAFAETMTIATATGKEVPEEVIGNMIKDLVMHEVGHTLGLRHNFKASSWLSTDDIKARRGTGKPLTASVMDYNADAFFAGDSFENGIINFATPTVGPYDAWAIEYGYRVPNGETGPEPKMLAKIASRSAEPQLAYGTDEDTMGLLSPDQDTNRWDMSSDAIAWGKTRIELANELMQNVDDWAINEQDGNERLRRVVGTLQWEKAKNAIRVARIVSGQSFTRSRPSDPNASAPLTLQDPKAQRDALKFLSSTVFNDAFWKLDADLYNKMPAARWWDWASEASPQIDYPVHRVILSQQASVLTLLMAPPALERVYDAELKSDADNKFTVAELVQATRDLVWSLPEAEGEYADTKPYLSSTRRNLQVQYLEFAQNYIRISTSGTSPDIAMMMRHVLRGVQADIKNLDANSIDFASQAHLAEANDRIERLLNGIFLDY